VDSTKSIAINKKTVPRGKDSKNMNKNMVSPALEQASSVDTHIFVPVNRIIRAATNHAVFKHNMTLFLMLPVTS